MRRLVVAFCTFLIAKGAFSQTIEAGKKLFYYERWNGARAHFEEMVKKDPSNGEAQYYLVRSLLNLDKLTEAKALPKKPREKQQPVETIAEAAILFKEGDTTSARKIIDEVVAKTKSKDPIILTQIVAVMIEGKSKDYNYMLDLLDRADKKDVTSWEIPMLKGDVYRRLTMGGKAVQNYEMSITRWIGNAKAAYNIGKIYLTLGDPELFLKYFNNAIMRDMLFAPPYYELYYYYYYRDVNKAAEYLKQYVENVEPSIENEYYLADLYYVSSKPKEAIEKAQALLTQEGEKAKPRLYKLIAYCYEALGDSAKALEYVENYFKKELDSNYVAKDYELRARLLATAPGNTEKVIADYEKAFAMDSLPKNKAEYATAIISVYKKEGKKHDQAIWQGKLFSLKENPTNIDLYNWGLAHYLAGDFKEADTVFAAYSIKYPEHIHGYYWRAKSNAIMDSTMETGAAVPLYEKVIELGHTDSLKNKSFLVAAYGYLGAYAANVKKDYSEDLENFEKILELDPANADAKKYSEILEKRVATEPEK